jgi:hypothetical protein
VCGARRSRRSPSAEPRWACGNRVELGCSTARLLGYPVARLSAVRRFALRNSRAQPLAAAETQPVDLPPDPPTASVRSTVAPGPICAHTLACRRMMWI